MSLSFPRNANNFSFLLYTEQPHVAAGLKKKSLLKSAFWAFVHLNIWGCPFCMDLKKRAMTYHLCFIGPEFIQLQGQEVAESETGKRKLLARMICTHWLQSTSREQQQISTWNSVRVCEEEEIIRDGQALRPRRATLKPKNPALVWLCVKARWATSSPTAAVSQSTHQVLKTSQHSKLGPAGSTWLKDTIEVLDGMLHFLALAVAD